MLAIQPFLHLAEYNVVVCTGDKCQFGVLAKEVTTHLRERHRDIEAVKRSNIAAAVAQIPNIMRCQADIARFQFPPPTAPRINALASPIDGALKCCNCAKIYQCQQVQKIQAHCREEHGWQNPRGPGRPSKKRKYGQGDREEVDAALPWRENVRCQRFFRTRYASGWFEIEYKDPDCEERIFITQGRNLERAHTRPTKDVPVNPATQNHVEAVLQRHINYINLQNQPRGSCKYSRSTSLAGISPWVDRTQWHIIYKDCRRDILATMTYLPRRVRKTTLYRALCLGQVQRVGEPDVVSLPSVEHRVARFLQAMDFVIERCERTVYNTCSMRASNWSGKERAIYAAGGAGGWRHKRRDCSIYGTAKRSSGQSKRARD